MFGRSKPSRRHWRTLIQSVGSLDACVPGSSEEKHALATPEAVLSQQVRTEAPRKARKLERRLDVFLLAGVAIAIAATAVGLYSSGVSLQYFLQPTGAVIVLGGTLGVMLITTPSNSLGHSLRRTIGLVTAAGVDRAELIEEIIHYARQARRGGI